MPLSSVLRLTTEAFGFARVIARCVPTDTDRSIREFAPLEPFLTPIRDTGFRLGTAAEEQRGGQENERNEPRHVVTLLVEVAADDNWIAFVPGWARRRGTSHERFDKRRHLAA